MAVDTSISNSLAETLQGLAQACRVLEMEGQGDRIWGHMAYRDPDGRGFWMKRAGVGLGEIHDGRDFVLLGFDGEKLAGDGKSHSEWPIHSEIFKRRPEIMATSHTHPFYASVFSASEDAVPMVVARSGIQPYMPPRYTDTSELIRKPEQGRAMAEAMGDHSAVFLRNHGIVTCGRTIPQPVLVAIAFEKSCREALTIGNAGFKWSVPDDSEISAKHEAGKGIINRSDVWAYYLRKLARAEAAGDPVLSPVPVPIEG